MRTPSEVYQMETGMVQSQVTLQTTLASHKVLEFIALWQNGDHGVLP